jgi:putative PIG3 family NAD(P)H quinone oxidoreductase
MRVIRITAPGGPEVLRMDVAELPRPGPSGIRVRVVAAGVNRADLLQRAGGYPAPAGWPPDVPGLEYAGVVDAVGEQVDAWAVGDRVMGLVGGGAYAEYVVTDAREAIPIPAGLSFAEAAAIPEVFITVHDALVTQMRIRTGQQLLIHGVGSGVGTAAVQLAAALGVATFGTARSAWKLERARELGLGTAIDRTREDFVAVIEDATGGRGVDGVLDLVGGESLRGNLVVLAPLGTLVVVGLIAGARAELDMRLLLRKRLAIRGTALRSRSLEEKIAVVADFRAHALPLFGAGRLRPVLDAVLPMQEAARAHERLAANENFGKVVLLWGPA